MSITKKDIAKNIKTKALTDNKTSNKLIDSFIEIVKSKSLSNDIKIAHFGTFINKVTPQRIGRNPKTGEEHIISERVKLNFVVSNKIKEQLNWSSIGRDGRIWTDDHYTPSVVRYQAALHPDEFRYKSIYNIFIYTFKTKN